MSLETKFSKMGAAVQVRETLTGRGQEVRPKVRRGVPVSRGGRFRRWLPVQVPVQRFAIDVRGERFIIDKPADADVQVLDLDPKDRHLLLFVKEFEDGNEHKMKFLCGHDERHWFVAGLPEAGSISTVAAAKDALKPEPVREAEKRVRKHRRHKHRNDARIRQGEWFFVPAPTFRPPEGTIRRNAPLSRGGFTGGGNQHILEEAVEVGGMLVYQAGPHTLDEEQREKFFQENPRAKAWVWTTGRADTEVYARGKVTHPEHKTVVLHGWHRVFLNEEPTFARGRRNIASRISLAVRFVD